MSGDGQLLVMDSHLVQDNGVLLLGNCCCKDILQKIGSAFTLTFVDDNCVEDDAFDVYLIKPDSSRRHLGLVDLLSSPSGCNKGCEECPKTTKTLSFSVSTSDVGPCCVLEIVMELNHKNCCGTYALVTLKDSHGRIYGGSHQNVPSSFSINLRENPAP